MNNSISITIESTQKREFPQKKHVQSLIEHLGYKEFECQYISSIYRIEGVFTNDEARTIAKEILCDPVVEKFIVNASPGPKVYFAQVWYKPGVTDTVGDSVLKAIKDLKIDSVERAFSGTQYVFSEASKNDANNKKSIESRIIEFATQQLLNPLVQECQLMKP
jgi:phosphoribosylformylglycinamidine (FGAM) synthase PurS component